MWSTLATFPIKAFNLFVAQRKDKYRQNKGYFIILLK